MTAEELQATLEDRERCLRIIEETCAAMGFPRFQRVYHPAEQDHVVYDYSVPALVSLMAAELDRLRGEVLDLRRMGGNGGC
jgi:hypothetical protein